jgi:hypothetical protein
MNTTAQLFLGFPINTLFAEKLAEIPSEILKFYICEGDNYLKKIEKHGICYLGKNVKNCVEFPTLQLLETNIYSLLKKIIPNYPYHNTPLVILATL